MVERLKLEEIDLDKYEFDPEKGIWSKHWGRWAEGYTDDNGYNHIWLVDKSGKKHPYQRKRVIAYVFCERPEHLKDVPYEYLDVDHKNGIRDDDRAENLRWCTHQENCSYPDTRKNKSEAMKGKNVGEKNGNYGKALTDEEKENLREKFLNREDLSQPVFMLDEVTGELKRFPSQMEAARQTGADQRKISLCIKGLRKSHMGKIWFSA